MTDKKFLNRIANGKSDVIQLFLDQLSKLKIDYCVIGGLAVNAGADPVASLDLDLVLAVEAIERLLGHVKNIFSIKLRVNSKLCKLIFTSYIYK